ncbi:L,D-transpeptidase, partial [Paenibacillus macerans]|uniref:L,D-transpeptidase n=1 Tax=Paenibacillus macerans TaxID=44252 RepID=UPI003D31228A
MTQQNDIHPSPANAVKICAYCGEAKPLGEFLRRTGKRSGKGERRGACRACRTQRKRQAAATRAEPDSIGQHLSHGCIRMRNRDVVELFELIP